MLSAVVMLIIVCCDPIGSGYNLFPVEMNYILSLHRSVRLSSPCYAQCSYKLQKLNPNIFLIVLKKYYHAFHITKQ